MLVRLIFFMALVAGGFTLFRWVRAKRLDRSGGLDVFEIERLMKLAKRSERVKEAMVVRVQVVEATPGSEKKEISGKIDRALRRLAQIEVLRERVKTALASSDRRQIEGQAALAREEAAAADVDRAESKQRLAEQLETQVDQLRQLHLREDELDEAADRLMVEMKNLHLALLNASSSEASSASGVVASALTQLEETAEGYRQQTSAEEEVEQLLKAARANQSLQRT